MWVRLNWTFILKYLLGIDDGGQISRSTNLRLGDGELALYICRIRKKRCTQKRDTWTKRGDVFRSKMRSCQY